MRCNRQIKLEWHCATHCHVLIFNMEDCKRSYKVQMECLHHRGTYKKCVVQKRMPDAFKDDLLPNKRFVRLQPQSFVHVHDIMVS